MLDAMIVIAKQPVAGRVKTRLVPALTYQQAADVAAAALFDTLRMASKVPARNHILAFDGCATEWLPAGWSLAEQRTGGLDARLVAAFAAAGAGPALLIGMDTPQATPGQLTAFDSTRYDACLGLAVDGGYWAIGFREPARDADVIAGIPMSKAYTGSAQLRALYARGLRVQFLDELIDIDTYSDAIAVADCHPQTRFADTFKLLGAERVG